MKNVLRHIILIISGGVLFSLDRWFKWQTLYEWNTEHLINRYFGWHPFANPGIAFGLPMPGWGQILLTIPVLCVLLFLLIKNVISPQSSLVKTLAFIFVIAGALSNLIDRFLYNYTVDYLLIFKSIINLADVLIVVGFVIYFIQTQKSKRKSQN